MNKVTYFTAIAAVAALQLGSSSANAATLSSLLGGGSLTEGDVIFGDFFFDDRFTDDDPAVGPFDDPADREDLPFAGDRAVAASEIDVTTSSTASSVTLTVDINPAISIAGEDANSGFEHIFDFFLDFRVRVASPSTRGIVGATLGSGDLFATGSGALSEVVYAVPIDNGVPRTVDLLEIVEESNGGTTSATEDTTTIAPTIFIPVFGNVSGQTSIGTTAGLSTYSLTFALSSTPPPPPPVVPLPASVVLLLAGLGGLGLVGRRRRA